MKPVRPALLGMIVMILFAGKVAAIDILNAPATEVIINDTSLKHEEIVQLAALFGGQVFAGDYWYDRLTGAWGLKCGPAMGIGVAGLGFGGELKADASCGKTGVFVNGRELHEKDLARLQSLSGYIAPARYWMDAQLNLGLEGRPALLNFSLLAAQRNRGANMAWSSFYNPAGNQPAGFGY